MKRIIVFLLFLLLLGFSFDAGYAVNPMCCCISNAPLDTGDCFHDYGGEPGNERCRWDTHGHNWDNDCSSHQC